ncbi:MAG: metalloregulator ArsR/SmtB family transcription factor [Campylobacteraceae bacterium]|nr:metalloregulator ArsR/SmtB family transcription factor [Campylobacteraceae bacterium]
MKELVKIAKIFSDSNRVNIFALILRDKQICVCEICDTLTLSQPLVSRHLKQMREADVLKVSQQSKWMLYTLSDEVSPILKCWINEIKRYAPSLPKLISCEKL